MSFFEKLSHQISANAGNAHQAFAVSILHAQDIDEFVEMLRGFHLGFMQIDKGTFVAEGVQIQLAGVLLSAAHYGRALVHSGAPPPKKITFALGTSRLPALWQGRNFGPHDLLMVASGIEIDLVTPAGYGIATASFPLELVEATADSLGWIPPTNATEGVVIGLEHSKAEMLRTKFSAAFDESITRPFNEQAAHWTPSKQEDLLRTLLRCTSKSLPSTRPVSNGERARVLKAALTAINDQPDDVLTVGDLCRIARASERTLYYAFTEHFGLPPAQYMKARRLNGAHNDLCREHDSSMKIADVANKWGFWHLGQFAKDYRSWFQELPSDTYERRHSADAE
jgi:AraC family ethanolamine operon transcriptional activator